ncbi:hypothetical protein [Pedobacter aquatilis]|uniref:hypothetical protein n=1 Tax=Pedobacter aquatilis TaxID=351343 RepID=UPI00292F6CE2|nr:hypothetical protein [Pedobacter aquatilis]
MIKKLSTILTCVALSLATLTVKAQSYKTGLGLGLDFGNGATLVGPSLRTHFNRNTAFQAEALFGRSTTTLQAFLQYNAPIRGARGLDWYIGGGPKVQIYDRKRYFFNENHTAFYLVPMAGLDYKIAGAPLAIAFDWRPSIYVGDNPFLGSEAGRFGMAFRFTF